MGEKSGVRILIDVEVVQPDLAIVDKSEAVGHLCMTGANRLHLGAFQRDAGLKLVAGDVNLVREDLRTSLYRSLSACLAILVNVVPDGREPATESQTGRGPGGFTPRRSRSGSCPR